LTLSVLDAQVAHSLGLGDLKLNSTLNQPLDAEVKLLRVGELDASQIRIKLATENDFNRAGVERLFFLTDLRFRVEVDGKGGGTLFISSRKLVREPFINFIMETRWPSGRLMREYTVLIDLPVYSDAQPVDNIKPAEQVVAGPGTASSGTIIRDASSQVTPSQTTSLENKPSNVSVKRQSTIEGDSYTTQVNDTLWDIAVKARPDSSVSVQQTMLAIQQKNPDAFINGNINRLKVAKNLQLPDLAEIRNRSRQQAVADVEQQNNSRDVSDRVIEAGNSDSSQAEATRYSESGQLRLKTPAEEGGSAGTGSGGGESGVETALVGSEENLSKVQRENQELRSRLNDMDGQVEDLQRVIDLQNARLERLQNQAAAEADVVVEQLETDTAIVVVDEQGEVVAIDEVVDTETVVDASGDIAVTEEVVEVLTEAEEPVEEPKAEAIKPAVLPAPLPEDSTFIDELIEDPVYLGAAGGLALLALLLVVMRRRKKNEADAVDSEFDPTMASAVDPLVDELEQPEQDDDFENLDFEAVATQEEQTPVEEDLSEEDFILDDEFEPLATEEAPAEESFISEYDEPLEQEVSEDAAGEADVYMAYGRYDQALEILDTSLAVNPDDEALHLKKMEVLASSGQREGFVAHYHLMTSLVAAGALSQAKELLSGVSDGAQWLEDINTITATDELEQDLDLDVALGDELELDDIEDFSEEDQADDIVADDSADMAELDSLLLDELDSDFSLDEDQVAEAEDDIELSLDGLDEDLSLSLDDEEVELSLVLDDSADNELSEAILPEGLDDLDIEMSDADIELISGLDDSALPNLDDEELPELDDLSLMADLEADSTEQGAADLSDFDAADDFDLSDTLEMSDDLDLSDDLNLGDLDLSALDESPSDVAGADLDDLSVDEDLIVDLVDEEQEANDQVTESVAVDEDEVATKLDLARAYIDMGDDDGARDILEEVAQEGDDSQRVEAEELLARIN
jgi:pilus assembly protein FimV